MDEKLVDKEYLLEKLPGKYGWTYTIIPEIRPDPNAPFNWVKVRGTIDSYQIKGYRLMPSGDVMPSGKGFCFWLSMLKSAKRYRNRQEIMSTLFYIQTMNQ